ncbi:ComF family protein [Acrocarpospora catenulata]|uniref:ComF family protein n=1 Tax=Acrocarpospora catenulata TaxID=2836182 RepID=UPI001BDB4C87|nr:phosphoribosyltransferase family protein [Acrocarpospora catenulata]
MLAALLDLLLPPRCAGCGRPGVLVCPSCTARLRGVPSPRLPEHPPPGLPEVWSGAAYAGVARRLLLAHKEHGRTALAPALGACLAATLRAALTPRSPVLLVPVPSSGAALRRRGHDPVRRMAAAAVRDLAGWPVVLAPVVRQRRRVADQAGLSAPERAANLAGAYVLAGEPPRPAVAVLVDDVVTTGATLAAAAAALRAAGVAVPLAITVAATAKERSGARVRNATRPG